MDLDDAVRAWNEDGYAILPLLAASGTACTWASDLPVSSGANVWAGP